MLFRSPFFRSFVRRKAAGYFCLRLPFLLTTLFAWGVFNLCPTNRYGFRIFHTGTIRLNMVFFTAAVYIYIGFTYRIFGTFLWFLNNIYFYIAPERLYPPPPGISSICAVYRAVGYLLAKTSASSADKFPNILLPHLTYAAGFPL